MKTQTLLRILAALLFLAGGVVYSGGEIWPGLALVVVASALIGVNRVQRGPTARK